MPLHIVLGLSRRCYWTSRAVTTSVRFCSGIHQVFRSTNSLIEYGPEEASESCGLLKFTRLTLGSKWAMMSIKATSYGYETLSRRTFGIKNGPKGYHAP